MPIAPRDSVKVSARIPGEHVHAMQAIVQSAETPFQTFTDILKHFIEEGVKRLPEMKRDPDLAEAAAMLTVYRECEKLGDYNKAESAASRLRSQLSEARFSGDEHWIGETREAALHFVKTTRYETIANKLQAELY